MQPRTFKNVVITGMSGSGGSYLAEHIVREHSDVRVHGFSRWHSTSAADNLRHIRDLVTLHEVDLNDMTSVLTALETIRPNAVFHLAAHANVRASFITPQAVLSNNILGTSNLLEGIRLLKLDPVIQICSTSEVYGQVDPKYVPITEETPMNPASPYAVSKVAQDLLGQVYFMAYKLRVIRTRMFAYLNPRREDLFASSFAKQVAWIERGLKTELVHGNLDSVRTLINVRDACQAYWDAVVYCQPGEAYNIGGAATMTVREFLDLLIAHAKVRIPTRCDPNLLRPADVTLQIPCVDKFVKATGWKPKCSFEDSVANLLDHWRKKAEEVSRV